MLALISRATLVFKEPAGPVAGSPPTGVESHAFTEAAT